MDVIDTTRETRLFAGPPASPQLAHEVARTARLQTAGVFLLGCAFFLALMSGHIYARDEETLFQMTDGIALHGEPLVSPEVWGIVDSAAPSKHGLRPTSYAPGQPLAATPLYWVGRAVGAAAGSRYAVYLNRFVVLAFNGFVTAATAAFLFRFALALGYRGRVGAALAVCYGAGTFALVQARTFFAEPLTACLVLLSFLLLRRATASDATDHRQRLIIAGSGFTIGAALLVKIHAALFLPVLALYLALTAFPTMPHLRGRSAWRSLLVRSLCWGGGFAAPLVALLLTNRWLYGGAFTTGYGDEAGNVFTTPLATGLHGLLYSSGKGIIWYAPPLVFAILGAPRFFRRFPREGIAVLSVAAINLLFYARLRYWHGDGSWGPRYLLIVLPWLLLPALPSLDLLISPGRGVLRAAARTGAVAVLLAGIVVQSLAVAVSFDLPILTSTSEHARFFTPAQSPIAISFRTARARFRAWWREEHPAVNTFLLDRGLYPSEGDRTSLFPRWTDGDALVALHPRDGAAVHLKLTYFDHRPAPLRATPTPVTVAVGGETLAPVDRLPIAPANEGFILAYDLSPALLRTAGTRVAIIAPTWNPAAAGVGDRDEPLGIFINNLEVWADGAPMTPREAVMLPGVPPTPRNVWVWSNYPEYPHLLDWWPVLLRDARMPGGLTAGIGAGMTSAVALLAAGGALCVRFARRPRAT